MVYDRLTVASTLKLFTTGTRLLINFMLTVQSFRRRCLTITLRDRSINASAIRRPAIITSSCHATHGILRALLGYARDVRISVINKLIGGRRITLLLRNGNGLGAITLAAKRREARFLLVAANGIRATRMDADVRVTTSRARRFVTLARRLVCNLIKISVLILLIRVNGLRNLARLRNALVKDLRTRSGTRRYNLAYAVKASSACSTIKQRRRIRILVRRFITVDLNRTLYLSGLITRAKAIKSRCLRLLFTLLLIFVRRFVV